MWKCIALSIILFLFTGCSKDKAPSPFEPFIGKWQGVAVNVDNRYEVHDITIFLPGSFEGGGIKPIVCDAIPPYKYVLFSTESGDLETLEIDFNRGDVAIFLRNEQLSLVAGISCRQTDNSEEIKALIKVFGGNNYNAKLYRIH